MNSQRINYQEHSINYHTYGSGKKTMLAFHGFGLTGASFSPIAEVLQNDYTIYSFDIFYHGHSYWGSPERSLSKEQWSLFIDFFCSKFEITNYSLLAFSMGGKFALTLLEKRPKQIDQVIFIAPDGIQTQIWYNLATYPLVFQKYFKSIIVKPQRFHSILSSLKKMGLVDKGISKFAASQMNSIKKRRRVYYSWVVFKELYFAMDEIANQINTNGIHVTMFLGKHDKIITEKGMNKLLKHLKDHKKYILDCGHNNLIEHTADFLNQNK